MKEVIAALRGQKEKAATERSQVEAVMKEAERRLTECDAQITGLDKLIEDARALENPKTRRDAPVSRRPQTKTKRRSARKPRRVADPDYQSGDTSVGKEAMARIEGLFQERGLLTQAEINKITSINAGTITRAMVRLFRTEPPQIRPVKMVGRSQQWEWIGAPAQQPEPEAEEEAATEEFVGEALAYPAHSSNPQPVLGGGLIDRH